MTSYQASFLLATLAVTSLFCLASCSTQEHKYPYSNVAAAAAAAQSAEDDLDALDVLDENPDGDDDVTRDHHHMMMMRHGGGGGAGGGAGMKEDMGMAEMEHPEPEDGHMMAMWFHFSTTAVILFKGWDIDGTGDLIGSMIGLGVISFLYEGLKVFKAHLRKSMPQSIDGFYKMLSVGHMIQSLLHMVQIWVGMCLMLVFMTYNVWLCLAVTVGGGCGYFVFAWMGQAAERQDYCH